jgi:hypothetical protein
MKNFLLSFVFLFFTISTIFAQTQGMRVGLVASIGLAAPVARVASVAQTSIRSVVAQGGELRMLMHVVEAGAYQVNICSMDGEIVYQETLQVEAGEVEHKIQFCGRVHGIYEVSLSGTGGQSTRQLIW